MENFWRPIIQEKYSVVRQLAIEANNFELKPALITMVQLHSTTLRSLRRMVFKPIGGQSKRRLDSRVWF